MEAKNEIFEIAGEEFQPAPRHTLSGKAVAGVSAQHTNLGAALLNGFRRMNVYGGFTGDLAEYRAKRNRKNRAAKAARRNNRKAGK